MTLQLKVITEKENKTAGNLGQVESVVAEPAKDDNKKKAPVQKDKHQDISFNKPKSSIKEINLTPSPNNFNIQLQPKTVTHKMSPALTDAGFKIKTKKEDKKETEEKQEQESTNIHTRELSVPGDDNNKLQTKLNEKDETLRMQPGEEQDNIQMKTNNSGFENTPKDSSELTSKLESTKGHGNPLPENTSMEMEQKIGSDLNNVRVHTGAEAVQMNIKLGAQAFTHGNDIYFNKEKYNPDSSSGKHLLAHELTHTIQQNQNKQLVQRNGEEEKEFKAYNISTNDIEQLRQYGLVVTDAFKEIQSILIISSRAHFYDRTGKKIGSYKLKGNFRPENGIYVGASNGIWQFGVGGSRKVAFEPKPEEFSEEARKRLVEKQSVLFSDWIEMDESNAPPLPTAIIAAPVIASDGKEGEEGEMEGEGGEAKKPPAWILDQKKALQDRINTARKQQPKPKDLPDKIQEWYNEKNQTWYLNVWVYFDTDGKTKSGQAIPLLQGESIDTLFDRVREATSKALLKFQDTQQREIEKEIPEWARTFKRNVEKEILTIRKKESKETNIPDGVELAIENNLPSGQGDFIPQPNEAEEEKKSEPKFFLNIWVERGKTQTQRKSGTVPWPLTPKTTVAEVMPMIRKLSAMLRQFEVDQPAKETIEKPEIIPPTDNLALSPFPAKILPIDLPSDNISVTGAKNNFQMSLDFESVYGGGELKDLYIASKLYQQAIHYYWKIFKVSDDLKLEEDDKKPKTWDDKWTLLYNLYNPPLPDEEKPGAAPKKIPPAGEVKFDGDTSDYSFRVKFPPEAGDYLVHCITGNEPIGEYKLRRISSQAYYPVRIKPIEQVGKQAASQRSTAIDNTKTEIEYLNKMLSNQDLGEQQKQMFQSVLREKSAYLERALSKESGSLSQNVDAEISYISETIIKLEKLGKALPKILDKASEKGVAPSQLLKEQDGALLDLYWYLIWQKTTSEAYKIELKEKLEQLKKLRGRAKEFSSEIKPSSKYQYAPEAAFVSKLTGQVYPLVLMIGEAPDSTGNIIKYSVVDITSKQTQEVYTGVSILKGKEGHKEAIERAFEDFGSDAKYGEGIIAVRFPPGKAGFDDPNHPGTDIKIYKSEEGILQKVLWALGIIGAIAGIAALAATGVGAPVAAAWLGVAAGVAGAITAIHNISERSKQHTLAWDAEMALDIIGILGVIPAVGGLKIARLSRSVAGFNEFKTLGRLVQVYGWTEMGATVLLVPTKLYEDFEKIDKDVANGDLTPEQAKAIKSELIFAAMQTAVMMIGSTVAARRGAKIEEQRMSAQQRQSLDQQAKFLELEGFGKQYKSLEERGWVDSNGAWTEKAHEISKPAAPSVEIETKPPVSGKKGTTVPEEVGTENIPKKVPPKPEPMEPTPTEAKQPGKVVVDEPTRPGSGKTAVPGEPVTKPVKPSEHVEDQPTVKPKMTETTEIEPAKPKPKAEATIEDSISKAEETVKKRRGDLNYFDNEVEAQKAKVRKAKGKKAKEEARKVLEENEALREQARQDYEIAKEDATQLRQKKLSSEIDVAKAAEEPILKRIQEKNQDLEKISQQKKENLSERDSIRDWIRDEKITKTQEQVQAKVKKLEQLEQKLNQLNKREESIRSKLRQDFEELSPLQKQTLKKIEALQAEQREAIGITPEEYEQLRSRSPSETIKKKIQKFKKDEVYDRPIEGTPAADHIVSMNEITQMPGFSKLNKQQKLKILNMEDNFMPLDSRVNSSKGDRSISEWNGYPPFGEIPPETKARLLQKETDLRAKIQLEINKMIPKP